MSYIISNDKYPKVTASKAIYTGKSIGIVEELFQGSWSPTKLGYYLKRSKTKFNCREVELGKSIILQAIKDIKPGEELISEDGHTEICK